MQQLLDTALEQSSPGARERFAQLTSSSSEPSAASSDEAKDLPQLSGPQRSEPPASNRAAEAGSRHATDTSIDAAVDWLDQNAGWTPGTARGVVASLLAGLDVTQLHTRGARRRRVNQHHIATAHSDYYHDLPTGYGTYAARYGHSTAHTSILTRPDWLDLECPMLGDCDKLGIAVSHSADFDVAEDQVAANDAARRLAETLALGVRLVNMPLYRLLDVEIRKGHIAGTVGTAPFVQYALTMDLLESELIDAVADGSIATGSLPIRDSYLPNAESVLSMDRRLCVGGVLALCAIARPASSHNQSDYLLIVQERSGHVLNAARKLAVIPKGFHQPLADIRADCRLGLTLQREMEEELFGRHDLDNTLFEQRHVDPMHPTRLSHPMRWLTQTPGALRLECTGFGLNLVSGNYEFASLIVINHDGFWARYGGQIEANWEAASLRRYSSLDGDLLRELVGDVAWSNEGLFALLQGLRRLSQIGGQRVNLPTVEWELRS